MTTPRQRGWLRPAAMGLLILAVGSPGTTQEGVGRSEAARDTALLRELSQARSRANEAGIASQKRIDEMSDQTDALFAKHNAAVTQLDALRTYNQSMREIVGGQEVELSSLRAQLEQVDAVGRSVTPLMLRMIDALDSFVSLDHPFLVDERTGRLAELRRLMVRADVSVAEKYRLIMEAYQAEAEYGRTIEAYRAALRPGNGATVDFLRFGRIALLYLTLDESEAGVWDAKSRSWHVLEPGFHDEVRTGLRIARKQVAPDLIELPLPAPSERGDAD